MGDALLPVDLGSLVTEVLHIYAGSLAKHACAEVLSVGSEGT